MVTGDLVPSIMPLALAGPGYGYGVAGAVLEAGVELAIAKDLAPSIILLVLAWTGYRHEGSVSTIGAELVVSWGTGDGPVPIPTITMLLVLARLGYSHADAVSDGKAELVGAECAEGGAAIPKTTALVLEWTECGHMSGISVKILDGTQEPPVPGCVARIAGKAVPGDVCAGPATSGEEEGEEW